MTPAWGAGHPRPDTARTAGASAPTAAELTPVGRSSQKCDSKHDHFHSDTRPPPSPSPWAGVLLGLLTHLSASAIDCAL